MRHLPMAESKKVVSKSRKSIDKLIYKQLIVRSTKRYLPGHRISAAVSSASYRFPFTSSVFTLLCAQIILAKLKNVRIGESLLALIIGIYDCILIANPFNLTITAILETLLSRPVITSVCTSFNQNAIC